MVQQHPVPPLPTHYDTLVAHRAFDAAATVLVDLAPPLFDTGQFHTWLDLFERLPQEVQSLRPDVLLTAGDVWRVHDHWTHASMYYEQARAVAQMTAQRSLMVQAVCRHALLCWHRGDVAGALARYEEAIPLVDPTMATSDVWYDLESGYALALSSGGRLAEAEACLQRQLRHAQRTSQIDHQWMLLNDLAVMVYLRRGAFHMAERTLREGLRLTEVRQHPLGEAYLTNSLAYTLNWQGHAHDALALSVRALTVGQRLAIPNVQAFALLNHAWALSQDGATHAADEACRRGLQCLDSPYSSPLWCDLLLLQSHLRRSQGLAQACHTAQEALTAARMQGDGWTTGLVLVQLADLCLDAAQFDRAHETLAEASTIFAQYGDQYHLQRCARLTAQLAHSQAAWRTVGQQPQARRVDQHRYPALEAQPASVGADLAPDGDRAAPLHPVPPTGNAAFAAPLSAPPTHPKLTATEWQVVRVLRDGKTNQQIAAQLCMTVRTVRFHLTNIYAKLGVANRGQAVAWIMAQEHDLG